MKIIVIEFVSLALSLCNLRRCEMAPGILFESAGSRDLSALRRSRRERCISNFLIEKCILNKLFFVHVSKPNSPFAFDLIGGSDRKFLLETFLVETFHQHLKETQLLLKKEPLFYEGSRSNASLSTLPESFFSSLKPAHRFLIN